jgi:predicted regulator of Ras-like GTPase activity (Roadblock/LC7/MglB family)
MTCFAYKRMFGVIKKLFRKSSTREALPAPRPLASTREDEVNPFAFKGESDPAISATSDSPPAPGDCLTVSYNAILRQLPKELYGKNTPGAGPIFSVAKSRVIEQLTQGAVKIPFGELRRSAPLGVFVAGSAHDSKMVDLPLKEILSQLQPEVFGRRPQQRVEIPDNIEDLFGSKGERLAPLRVLDKDDLLKPTIPSGSSASVAAKPVTAPAVRRTLPAAPLAAPGLKPALRSTALPTPASHLAKPKALTPTPSPKPAALAKPSIALPKAPEPASQPAVSEANHLLVRLGDIAQAWPEAVRQEITELDLENATCGLPLDEIGQSLKQGAIHYTWQQIRASIKGAPPLSPSVHGETILPLPLQAIAPLYMARGGTHPERKKISMGEEIPDIFLRTQPPGASRPAAPVPSRTQTAVTQASAAAPTVGGKGTLTISLSALSANWPPSVRNEITQLELNDAVLELPMDAIEAGLKLGKVDCVWKQICTWLKACPPEALASTHAETRLELPLNVLAPLFLQRRTAPQPRKTAVPIGVPDLFSSAGEQLTTAVPDESASPVSTPASLVAPPNVAENLAELFGEPEKRNWTPNEIVHKTSLLPGVAGALIALQDGLLVASCMPPVWKTETIAAFLPQIFGRMKQYAKELKMGELTSVSFAVDQGILQIFNAGIIYFAALGKPDASLPTGHLNLIARELSRHTK